MLSYVYGRVADILRLVCSKKPFAKRRGRHKHAADIGRTSVELNQNVVQMKARGCAEVKAHPWFDYIDLKHEPRGQFILRVQLQSAYNARRELMSI